MSLMASRLERGETFKYDSQVRKQKFFYPRVALNEGDLEYD
jgi:hypothetical protein